MSIAENAFSDEVKHDITAAFKKADENKIVSRPIDIIESTTPEKWKSVYGKDIYQW